MTLRRIFWLSLLVHILTAYLSEGYFHLDEHFQILEWVKFKLEPGEPASLPWEFQARIRPFFQVFLYYLPAKAFYAWGGQSTFVLAFILRALTGIFAWFSTLLLFKALRRYFPEDEKRLAWLLCFLFCVPFLHVRTSSEALSGAFFWLGFALCLLPRQKNSYFFLAGLCLAAAFEARFQSAFLTLGFLVWAFFRGSFKAKHWFFLGWAMGLVFFAGRIIDIWGYADWVLTPWRYFARNILEGEAARHGTSFPGYYAVKAFIVFPPVSSLLTVATLWGMWRYRRESFAGALIIFFLAHSAIAHKELRFLFPMVVMCGMFLVPLKGLWSKALYRRSFWLLNILGLLYLSFTPAKSEMALYRATAIQPNFKGYVYVEEDPYLLDGKFPYFYLPRMQWQRSFHEMKRLPDLFYMAFYQGKEAAFKRLDAEDFRCTALYSEWPEWVRSKSWLATFHVRNRELYRCRKNLRTNAQ